MVQDKRKAGERRVQILPVGPHGKRFLTYADDVYVRRVRQRKGGQDRAYNPPLLDGFPHVVKDHGGRALPVRRLRRAFRIAYDSHRDRRDTVQRRQNQ